MALQFAPHRLEVLPLLVDRRRPEERHTIIALLPLLPIKMQQITRRQQTTDAEGAVLIVVNKEQEGAMSPLQSAREEEDKEDYRNTEM